MKPKSLLIHNNNSFLKDKVNEKLSFGLDTYGSSAMGNNFNIDRYISDIIIPKIKKIDFDVLYIKDSLSSNYMEFYGLLVAYHVRLTKELGDKRFVPIIILSELDGYIINKLSNLGKIIFTKNVFISTNTIKSFDFFQKKIFDKLSLHEIEYQENFLNIIDIPPPKDYLSHHEISNEWAIYRWSEFLKVESEAIKKNREKIVSMLYFKYLLAKNPIDTKKKNGIQFVARPPEKSGKILYIDDEWAKGWSDILKQYFSKNQNIEFKTFEYDFKNNNKFITMSAIKNSCQEYVPDVVLLDLRLTQSDHETKETESLTGIKIRQLIKEINPAIQVIMFTATSKSLILENLYSHGILGYIKKEHPTDIGMSTKESFDKLKNLVDKGLDKKYLKEVWEIQNQILSLNLFEQDNLRQMRFEINSIFEILDSEMNKRYTYAMLSIFQALEEINNYYINDNTGRWIDTDESINSNTYTKTKILKIMHERLQLNDFDTTINSISRMRKHAIHPPTTNIEKPTKDDILTWFKMLQTILEKIER